MRVLVISNCTTEQQGKKDGFLTMADLRSGRLSAKEATLEHLRRPAGELFTGQQHSWMMKGVRLLREKFGEDAVTVKIVSAAYGLVPESEPLLPYEVTFAGMAPRAAEAWARKLDIPGAVREAVKGYDLVFFLLGNTYLKAIVAPPKPVRGQRHFYLAPASESAYLVSPGVTCISAGIPESRHYKATAFAVKGKMFYYFCRSLADQGLALYLDMYRDGEALSFLTAAESAMQDDVA